MPVNSCQFAVNSCQVMVLYLGTLTSYRDLYEIVKVVVKKHGNVVYIDVMKMMKKVKIDSRSFYLSQTIYILQGSHTVENSNNDIDYANRPCQSVS